jgi:hypothetical protein
LAAVKSAYEVGISPAHIASGGADATVSASARLADLALGAIDMLASIARLVPKGGTRVRAAQILLEHALGKPKQAVVPARGDGGELTWEALLEKIRAAAAADAAAEKPPTH